jgi:hypothetical protein
MPCEHKFINDLNLNGLNFEPTTLIIGTFNPSWPAGNMATWFYGRTHDVHGNQNNSFWDVLPRLFPNEPSLINAEPAEWKQFCARQKIAITDLITCISDADENNPENLKSMKGYADNVIAEEFHEHTFTNIIQILQNRPTINRVYITNGVNGGFWNNLWTPIAQYCNQNNIICDKLLTPSKNARFSMFPYNRNNPDNQYTMATLNDYILMKWQEVWDF